MKKIKNECLLCTMLLFMCTASLMAHGKRAEAAGKFVISKGVLVEYKGNSSSVTLPSSVKKIGASAFEGNKKLKYVNIPGKVTEIGAQAFKDCTSLKNVNCKDNITVINVKAFSGCKSLSYIHFSKNCVR